MPSIIRNPTKTEKEGAEKFSNRVGEIARSLTEKLEEEGFRVILGKDSRVVFSILLPCGKALDWNYSRRSLDELYPGISREEYDRAVIYATLTGTSYLLKQTEY